VAAKKAAKSLGFCRLIAFWGDNGYITTTWFLRPVRRPSASVDTTRLKRAEPAETLKTLMPFFPRPSARCRVCGTPLNWKTRMAIGTVKFFNTAKGFGFIAPEGGGKDVFVHATAVEAAGMRTLNEGQKVSFDIQPDARGSKAANLKAV
jgi:cold shock protein